MNNTAMMSEAGMAERRWMKWGLVFLCWAGVGVFFAGRNVVASISRGRPIAWVEIVCFELIYWLIWGLFTPAIFSFVRRYRILPPRRAENALKALGFGLVVAPLQVSLEAVVSNLIAWRALHHPTEEVLRRLSSMPRIILIESFTGFVTYAVIVGCFYAFDYYQKFRERELRAAQLEGRLAQAELQNLKMQLHPHFLFNTLHAVSVLMQEDVTAANRMLVRLSELLRVTLDNAGTQETSLKQEMEFLQRYLDIEQIRFADRCQVRIKIDPAALDARVPSLILQPLVENALRHGVARRAGVGVVEITGQREGDKLRLKVRDNGPGLREDIPAALAQGVGLSNTQARLTQLYGGAASLEISNAAEDGALATAADGGVLVTVVIPFQPHHPDSERSKDAENPRADR
jgi:two-component system, LytTR family, sensor kinase